MMKTGVRGDHPGGWPTGTGLKLKGGVWGGVKRLAVVNEVQRRPWVTLVFALILLLHLPSRLCRNHPLLLPPLPRLCLPLRLLPRLLQHRLYAVIGGVEVGGGVGGCLFYQSAVGEVGEGGV